MNSASRSLVLMNHFPDNPDLVTACRDNSAALLAMVNTCRSFSGNRWPNFIAVDFYKVLPCSSHCDPRYSPVDLPVDFLLRGATEEELRRPRMLQTDCDLCEGVQGFHIRRS